MGEREALVYEVACGSSWVEIFIWIGVGFASGFACAAFTFF